MTVEYHPAIERELSSIRDYYEHRAGLGREFLDEFERQVLRIAEAPTRWMIVTGDVRRCPMSRFPYVIYFRQPAVDRIRITVVKHARQHPQRGRGRR